MLSNPLLRTGSVHQASTVHSVGKYCSDAEIGEYLVNTLYSGELVYVQSISNSQAKLALVSWSAKNKRRDEHGKKIILSLHSRNPTSTGKDAVLDIEGGESIEYGKE